MIFNLETEPLPENWTPLDAVAVVKCLDEEGNLSFVIRSTQSLTDWECYGLLAVSSKIQAKEIMDGFETG